MTTKLSAFAVLLALAACSGGGDSGTTGVETTGNNSVSGGSSTGAKGSSSAAGSSTGKGNGTTGAPGTSSAGTSGSSTGNATSSGTPAGTTGTTGGANGTTGGTTGTPCTYDNNSGADSCTASGYECSAEFSTANPSICVLPEDLAVCDGDPAGDVGCQDGGVPNGKAGGTGDLFCSTGFQNNSGMVDLCLYNCVDTTDCPNLIQSCISAIGGCFNNYCGFDSSGTFVGPFYGTCGAESTADGQCLSFDQGGLGVCFENGTADVGEPCNPIFRYGAFSECTYGNYCVPTLSGDGGLCFAITIDGGTCADGDDLVGVQTNADWAVCVPDCTTSMDCDGGTAGTTCQPLSNGTTSVCLP